jgi:ABC-type sugar transport system permease subunit
MPVLAFVGLIIVVPMAYVAFQSTHNWKPGSESPFIGWQNYDELFASEFFHQVLWNQAVLLLGLPIYVLTPFLISLVLFDRVRGASVFRTIFFFPAVLSPAIVGIMFRVVLAPDGPFNELLRRMGLDAFALDWLNDEDLVKPVLIVLLTWAGMGVGIIIFSAALSALPLEQLEAATLDGANWWQSVRYIILPELRPVIGLWAAYQTISLFAFSFGWVYVLTSGGPNGASTTIDFDIYQNAFTFGAFGIAAAESVVLLGIIATLAAAASGATWLRRRREHSYRAAPEANR